MQEKRWFFSKKLLEKTDSIQTDWSGRPVPTNGKRFKIVSELSETD